MKNISAYYSHDYKCWVRLEKEIDGEYSHTTGFNSKEEALNTNCHGMKTKWLNTLDLELRLTPDEREAIKVAAMELDGLSPAASHHASTLRALLERVRVG